MAHRDDFDVSDVILTCGHVRPLTDRETFTPHRVVRFEGGWGVSTEGSWCAACVSAGKAPRGMSWQEAWDEVARRRDGQPAPDYDRS